MFRASDNTNRDDENFFVNMFASSEIYKAGFYFSYTYDLTHTLQENILRKINNRDAALRSTFMPGKRGTLKSKEMESYPWESMFMWNRYMVEEFYERIDCKLWITPFIHGYVSQLNFEDMNKCCSVILISRRSRFYAGTRYLKRGINDLGHSANHVETE